jgi:hypothetical protein
VGKRVHVGDFQNAGSFICKFWNFPTMKYPLSPLLMRFLKLQGSDIAKAKKVELYSLYSAQIS